jgi:hypothetical protein
LATWVLERAKAKGTIKYLLELDLGLPHMRNKPSKMRMSLKHLLQIRISWLNIHVEVNYIDK